MNIEQIDTTSEIFDEIVEDIKRRNLSRNNMPKLIVGTGLSIIYGIPGMQALAEKINEEINNSSDQRLKDMWKLHYSEIIDKGLEMGLANLSQEENDLVSVIKSITSKYILEQDESLHKTIYEKDTGFCVLLDYLRRTVSVGKKVIDIMTPNYDRIIEIVCDKVGVGTITGFSGNLYGRFDKNILRKPTEVYNCKSNTYVRIFKPHGSINWINENGTEYLTNDYKELSEKVDYIEIVTPGGSKYKAGLTNNTFRCMREEFNELLSSEENYSLLFFGYGFNDDHFDIALFDSFQKDVLILSKDVKKEIISKAFKSKNITIFYHDGDKDCMIYKSKKYIIDLPLWDIDKFADVFIG